MRAAYHDNFPGVCTYISDPASKASKHAIFHLATRRQFASIPNITTNPKVLMQDSEPARKQQSVSFRCYPPKYELTMLRVIKAQRQTDRHPHSPSQVKRNVPRSARLRGRPRNVLKRASLCHSSINTYVFNVSRLALNWPACKFASKAKIIECAGTKVIEGNGGKAERYAKVSNFGFEHRGADGPKGCDLAEVGFEDTLIRKCKALSNGAIQAWGDVGEDIGGERGFDVGE